MVSVCQIFPCLEANYNAGGMDRQFRTNFHVLLQRTCHSFVSSGFGTLSKTYYTLFRTPILSNSPSTEGAPGTISFENEISFYFKIAVISLRAQTLGMLFNGLVVNFGHWIRWINDLNQLVKVYSVFILPEIYPGDRDLFKLFLQVMGICGWCIP